MPQACAIMIQDSYQNCLQRFVENISLYKFILLIHTANL